MYRGRLPHIGDGSVIVLSGLMIGEADCTIKTGFVIPKAQCREGITDISITYLNELL